MSGWIKVTNRLPERSSPIVTDNGERPAQFSDSVLVYPAEFDQIGIGSYWFDANAWELDDSENTRIAPKYWMPLPEVPQ
jgi:hypothetical protein